MRSINGIANSLTVGCSRLIKPALLSITMMLTSVVHNSAAATRSDAPIRFEQGAISNTLTGRLTPKENEHWYHFTATHQQYMVINILPLKCTSETANVGVLHIPDGTQSGNKGGIIYQGCLPESGDYRLRLARNLMATKSLTAGYKAEVMILPPHASKP